MKKFLILLLVLLLLPMNIYAEEESSGTLTITQSYAPDQWAAIEVDEAKSLGLLTDNTSNYFKKDINRYAFAELIVNCIEKAIGTLLTSAPATTFTDSTEECILKAFQAGVVKGIGENRYDPYKRITRQEIAAMMYRAISYIENQKGKEVITQSGDIEKFSDKDSVADWAKEAVGILAQNSIMKGTSDTTLSPLETTTIQEAVLLDLRIYRLMK